MDDNDTTAKWIGVIITPIQRLPVQPLWSSTRVIQSDKSTSFIHTYLQVLFHTHTLVYKTTIYVIPETITVAFTPLPGPLVSRNLIAIKSELLCPVHPAPAAPMLPQFFQNASNKRRKKDQMWYKWRDRESFFVTCVVLSVKEENTSFIQQKELNKISY